MESERKSEMGSSGAERVYDNVSRGQATIFGGFDKFTESMTLNCVVRLGIADIISSHGSPLSLSYITKNIDTPLNINRLSRIMTFLVCRGIFTATPAEEDKNITLYGLTNSSKWLLRDSKTSLAPMLLLHTSLWVQSFWQHLTGLVLEQDDSSTTTGFAKANGTGSSRFASTHPEYNTLFNEAMAKSSMITVQAMKKYYKDGFDGIGILVDVAGGTGATIGEIVEEHPHIRGTNFDLPHVVAVEPEYPGVTHVAGDMFTSIPQADAIMLKRIMHDWNDEDCIKILRNCRKAIPENSGKVIIIDAVLEEEGTDLLDDIRFMYDLFMMVQVNGKERKESEWKQLLEAGGFRNYKIIKIPDVASIIELQYASPCILL